MKKLITERDLEHLDKGAAFQVEPQMILTPSARDFASSRGIRLSWSTDAPAEGAARETAMDRAIREAVTAELGKADHDVMSAVRNAMSDTPRRDHPVSKALREAAQAKAAARNRAVLSAMGENQVGILSRLTKVISELGCDINDVSQSIVGGYFTMILIVDLAGLGQHTFEQFRELLLGEVRALGLEGMLMHEDVLRAMHRV